LDSTEKIEKYLADIALELKRLKLSKIEIKNNIIKFSGKQSLLTFTDLNPFKSLSWGEIRLSCSRRALWALVLLVDKAETILDILFSNLSNTTTILSIICP
jgi:uncharacterized membrane protein